MCWYIYTAICPARCGFFLASSFIFLRADLVATSSTSILWAKARWSGMKPMGLTELVVLSLVAGHSDQHVKPCGTIVVKGTGFFS